MRKSILTGSFAIGVLASALPAAAQTATSSLGEMDFPVSCNAAAQEAVTEGTLLLHHMMYRMAEMQFNTAAHADPTCAMAQWGIAMSNFHPLWPGIQFPAERDNWLAAIDRAAGLDSVTPLEQAYIDAAAEFYHPDLATYPERRVAWATAQQQILGDYPHNPDVAAFAALAMLANAPRGDQSFVVQREAGALLEGLTARAPRHPSALHYMIHAYYHPPLAEAALPFVAAYLVVAPEIPHALHVPSHIKTRLGQWEEAADLNRRSAAAVLAQPMIDGTVSNHYPHALDYLAYALLQLGEVGNGRCCTIPARGVTAPYPSDVMPRE